MSKKPDFTNRLPLNDHVQEVEYNRPPTKAEIKFGHGDYHFRFFTVSECCWPGTRFTKRWIVAPDDKLRYYRM